MPVPTVKATVREVLVDVVVTDSKGDPIPGLKHEDFQLLEDGKPQTPIHKEIDVPAGEAFLRTGIYDLKSNNAGTLGIPLAVSASVNRKYGEATNPF